MSDINNELFYNKALLENMSILTDVVWAVDTRSESVTTLIDKITPPEIGQDTTISLEEFRDAVRKNNPPEDAVEILKTIDLESLLSLKQSEEYTTSSYKILGKTYCMRCVRTPEFDQDGNVIRVYITLTNIQNQKDADRALLERDIIKALIRDFLHVYIVNPDNETVVAEKIEGFLIPGTANDNKKEYPYDEILEMYISSRILEEDRPRARKELALDVVLAALQDSDEYIGNYRVLIGEDIHYYQYKIIRLSDARIIAGFRCIDSIVEQQTKQRKLIEESLASAEKANRAKTTFLNNMSHDIRTPMNAIVGYTQLAITHQDDKKKVNDYLNKIQSSSQHLLSLINDVLDISRIESGKMQIEVSESSLPGLLTDIKNMMINEARKKNILLSVDYEGLKDEMVLCDKVRLEQVIINCVGNAVKFTPAHGKIWLSLKQLPNDNENFGKYQFKIKDTGIGMSPEFVAHVFEPFERDKSNAVANIQGTGLGMAICKSIVDMMAGEISVESTLGEGSEFTITLSFKLPEKSEDSQQPEETVAKPVIEQRELDGVKVLVVEDNESSREIATILLQEIGAVVDCAENGYVAVEKIRNSSEDQYDVVLMDTMMPIMDGIQATKQIRKLSNRKQADIPIIALTANAFEEDKRRVMAAGMNGHVTKPVDINVLSETINHVLEKETLKQIAYRDSLTGLYTRHYITSWVKLYKKNPVFPISYVSIDVNNLKKINDNYGHSSGDHMLKTFSEILMKHFNELDSTLIRTGGDEFLILCKGADFVAAKHAVELVQREALQVYIEDEPITFCSGVITQDKYDYNFDSGVKAADEIMMQSKRLYHIRM